MISCVKSISFSNLYFTWNKTFVFRFYHLFVHVIYSYIYKLKRINSNKFKIRTSLKDPSSCCLLHGINVSIFNLYSQFHFFQLKTRLINDDMHNKICILLFKSETSSRLIYDILSKYGKVSYVKMFIQVLWLCYKLYKCAKTWSLFVLRLKQTN